MPSLSVGRVRRAAEAVGRAESLRAPAGSVLSARVIDARGVGRAAEGRVAGRSAPPAARVRRARSTGNAFFCRGAHRGRGAQGRRGEARGGRAVTLGRRSPEALRGQVRDIRFGIQLVRRWIKRFEIERR